MEPGLGSGRQYQDLIVNKMIYRTAQLKWEKWIVNDNNLELLELEPGLGSGMQYGDLIMDKMSYRNSSVGAVKNEYTTVNDNDLEL